MQELDYYYRTTFQFPFSYSVCFTWKILFWSLGKSPFCSTLWEKGKRAKSFFCNSILGFQDTSSWLIGLSPILYKYSERFIYICRSQWLLLVGELVKMTCQFIKMGVEAKLTYMAIDRHSYNCRGSAAVRLLDYWRVLQAAISHRGIR